MNTVSSSHHIEVIDEGGTAVEPILVHEKSHPWILVDIGLLSPNDTGFLVNDSTL